MSVLSVRSEKADISIVNHTKPRRSQWCKHGELKLPQFTSWSSFQSFISELQHISASSKQSGASADRKWTCEYTSQEQVKKTNWKHLSSPLRQLLLILHIHSNPSHPAQHRTGWLYYPVSLCSCFPFVLASPQTRPASHGLTVLWGRRMAVRLQ